MPPKDRSKMKLPDLRKECAERGIRAVGRKHEIVDRLEDYDRNADFRGPPIVYPSEEDMAYPEPSMFKSLLTSHKEEMPKVFFFYLSKTCNKVETL